MSIAIPIASLLALMHAVPAVEGDLTSRPGHFDRFRDAPRIAVAIAHVAETEYEARLMVVYAAYESGNVATAVGDKGLSLGTWQLRGVSRDCAFEPECAARVWIKRARQANLDCADNAPEERLAPLASGNCDHALRKTRRRIETAEMLAAIHSQE